MSDKVFWKPHSGPQEEILRRGEFELGLGGSRGGGKSEAGRVFLIEPSYVKHSRYRFLVIRQHAKDLADWIDKAKVMYQPLNADFIGNPCEIRFPSGAIGRTGHLKDKKAFEQYLGHEYHKMLIEECTLIPSEEYYLKLLSSCRTTIPELAPQVLNTTNPGNAGHIWYKQRFISKCVNKPYLDPKTGRWRIFIPATVEDNPTLMKNDPSYVKWLEGLPEKLKMAWRYGSWDAFEGQFFDEWDETFHVYEPFNIPKHWPRFRAMDWGFSDHFCCLWFAVGPENHIFVYREFYRNRLTDSEYAQMIMSMSKYPDGSDERIEYTVGDPSSFWVKNPDTGVPRYETFQINGIGMLPANNDRIQGWSRVREYLQVREMEGRQKAWLHISKECTNLIRTLPALVHDDLKHEDVADGSEDHPPDALRYGCMSRSPRVSASRPRYRNHLEAAEAQMKRNSREGVDLWK